MSFIVLKRIGFRVLLFSSIPLKKLNRLKIDGISKPAYFCHLLGLIMSFFSSNLIYANQSIVLLPITSKLDDKASIQRGAHFFLEYCAGCHSLRYLSYDRLANDVGINDNRIDFIGLIKNSMPITDAKRWFGVLPPDLSLITRQHSSAWLYTYLNSFYQDSRRPFYSNNVLVPNIAMPDVLASLRGQRLLISANNQSIAPYFITIRKGILSETQFQGELQDLVSFLAYVSEPTKQTRYRVGYWVLGYLVIFFSIIYCLKKNYMRHLKTKN